MAPIFAAITCVTKFGVLRPDHTNLCRKDHVNYHHIMMNLGARLLQFDSNLKNFIEIWCASRVRVFSEDEIVILKLEFKRCKLELNFCKNYAELWSKEMLSFKTEIREWRNILKKAIFFSKILPRFAKMSAKKCLSKSPLWYFILRTSYQQQLITCDHCLDKI